MENPLLGRKFKNKTDGRVMTIIGDYYEGKDDHGYIYQWDNDKATHWLSTNSLNVSFEKDTAQ